MAGRSGQSGPPEGAPRPEVGAAYRYASLGLTFAGGMLLFMGLGYGLDRWVGTLPFGTVIGTLAGAVLSFLVVYRRVIGDERSRAASREPPGRA